MKIKIVSVLVLTATVWLQPGIAAEETVECQACKYLYDNLYVAFNQGNVINESYMRDQSIVFCNNYEYSHECMEIADQNSGGIYELLQNGADTHIACYDYLNICSCGAGQVFGTDSCEPCSRGYYKSELMTTCAQCPKQGSVYGTTLDTGSTAITDCYISAGTAFTDTTGGWTWTADCYYK